MSRIERFQYDRIFSGEKVGKVDNLGKVFPNIGFISLVELFERHFVLTLFGEFIWVQLRANLMRISGWLNPILSGL